MNHLKSSLLLTCLLLFSACSSDDSSPETDSNAAVIGVYSISAVNVSPAQDINEDGTPSSNLLDELSCITGTLNVNSDKSWNLNLTNINVTSITGGQFFIDCGDNTNSSGTWTYSNNQLSLNGSFEPSIYILNGDALTRQIGQELPDFQSIAFTKN